MNARRILSVAAVSVLATTTVFSETTTASATTKFCNYNYVIAFNWINQNPDGGMKIISGLSKCTPEYDDEGKQIADLGALHYDFVDNVTLTNTISSVNTLNRCDVKFYDGTNFTGASTPWIDIRDNLADYGFYDRASSLRIS